MTKTHKKIIFSILSVILVVLVFVSGFFIGKGSNDIGTTYSWIWQTVNKYYYEDITEEEFMARYNAGGITYALDAYSAYYTASEYSALKASNSGSKSGFGLSYSYVTGHPDGADGILLTSVIGNSPAYQAGLRRGTILTSGTYSDGQTVTFNSASSLSVFLTNTSTGENVTLTDSEGTAYTVARSSYTASYAYLATNSTAWTFQSAASGSGLSLIESPAEKISYLPDGYGYLYLSQFYGTAASEVGILLAQFNSANCNTLILDLRNNGGGQVSTMQNMSWYFTANVQNASSVAMYAQYRDGSTTSFSIPSQSKGEAIKSGTQVYVLANNNTASASEALIGVLVSCGLVDYSHIYISNYSEAYVNWYTSLAGISVSSFKNARTYGKGIMQSTVTRITGEALKLTTAKIYWPDKTTSIHGVGLNASMGCKLVTADWSVTKHDDELKAVIQNITA
jgi:carboxyl-terminal processing protease